MRLVRIGNGARACRAVLVACLLVAGAGCEKKETETERLQRAMSAEQAQSELRLNEMLTELEARLAKQEDAFRRVRDDTLPLEQRLDLLDACGAEMDQTTKQVSEIRAAVDVAARKGGFHPTHRERLTAAAERLDRLSKEWATVIDRLDPELQKLKKAAPPKK